MDVGTRIRQLRKRARMTQPELAEQLGVHETTIRRWEREKDKGPDIQSINALAQVFNISPSELLDDGTEEKENSTLSQSDDQSQTLFKKIGNALVYERNGERMEMPPTEQSYAIFRELAMKIAERGAVTA